MTSKGDIGSEYPCCAGDVCPQHVQQYREDQRWAEIALQERRNIGHTGVSYTVFGSIAA